MREITRSVKVALKCLIEVVLVDVDLPYWTSKVEHIVAFTVMFSNICTAHAQKRLFMNFRCKFRHRRSVRRPRFPITVQNFSDLATFPLILAFFICAKCPSYLYFRFVWPTDLESISHASTPTSIIPTKFEPRTPIRSWVMSDNVSHWLPLKMRTRPLRMRRITWPVSRGSKTITYLESPTPICLFTIQALDCVNFFCVTLWPWRLTFWPWTVVIHGESRDQPRHRVWRP